MEITIDPEIVIIILENGVRFNFTLYQLSQIEIAFEIIRYIKKTAPVESATITIA